VPALERDLQRVLADQAHILDPQLFRRERFHAGQAPRGTRFAPAFGARACPPELLAGIRAAVAALPFDLHHLALAIHIDVEWERVWILQVVPLPDVDDRKLSEGLDGSASRHL